jgi:hypothetical protein
MDFVHPVDHEQNFAALFGVLPAKTPFLFEIIGAYMS